MRLDVFSGQICAVIRTVDGNPRMVIQIQIAGLRARSERTGRYVGRIGMSDDLALTGDQGIPGYLAEIGVPVLVLGGANSPDWFHRTVEATTGAVPGARLVMLEGQDHGAPPEVIAPILTEFFLGS